MKIKPLKDFPNYYVDTSGRIYSKKRYQLHQLQGIIARNGYVKVCLRKDGNNYTALVHRLVALTFIPNLENKSEVNHKNGIKTDNRVENLEWVTDRENKYHSYRVLGNKAPWKNKFGKDNPKSKIILQIKDGEVVAEFYGSYEAYRKTGISYGSICDCCNGKHKQAHGYQWKYK